MTSHPPPQKVYVNHQQEAALTCPQCHRAKLVNFAPYLAAQLPIKVQCRCGYTFVVLEVLPEARGFARKRTRLPGSYAKPVGEATGGMTVQDISFTGIRFATDDAHDLAVDDVLGVRFVLDDQHHTELRRTVVIRHVQGRCIGAAFCDPPGDDRDLIAYLAAPVKP